MAEARDNLSPDARRVVRLLQTAAERAKREILNPPGGTDNAKAFNASRAAQRLAGIRRELEKFKVEAARVAGEEIGRAYRIGIRRGEQLAAQAGVNVGGIRGSFTQIDSSRAAVLSRQTAGDLAKAFDSIGNVAERVMRRSHALGLNDEKINRIIAGGTIDGTPQQTLQELRKELRKVANNGMVEVVNPRSGLVTTFKPNHYADLVFQTKTREATVIATAGRLQDSGIDLVEIIGSNSANFCTAFVGKVFSLSGKHPTYPPFDSLPHGGPPFHPRCSKSIVAFVEELATADERRKSEPDDAVRELINKSPTDAARSFRQTVQSQ